MIYKLYARCLGSGNPRGLAIKHMEMSREQAALEAGSALVWIRGSMNEGLL